MTVTQYIGSRYVPIFATPVEWTKEKAFEPLTIVTHEGNSYTSKQYTPVGIDITDTEYWVCTGNYNSQIEQYRTETKTCADKVNTLTENVELIKETAETGLSTAKIAKDVADVANTKASSNSEKITTIETFDKKVDTFNENATSAFYNQTYTTLFNGNSNTECKFNIALSEPKYSSNLLITFTAGGVYGFAIFRNPKKGATIELSLTKSSESDLWTYNSCWECANDTGSDTYITKLVCNYNNTFNNSTTGRSATDEVYITNIDYIRGIDDTESPIW